MSPLLEESLRIARTQLHVREDPPGSNRGPAIDEYLRAAGLDQPASGRGHPYCVALVAWSLLGASRAFDRARFPILASVCPPGPGFGEVPIKIGAHVGRLWQRTPLDRRLRAPRRGAVFVWMRDPSRPDISPGHAGFVEEVIQGPRIAGFDSVEGNTGPGPTVAGTDQDRDGDGVRAKRRPLSYPTGYIWLGEPDRPLAG